jgi:hypothetical protein
MNEQLALHPSSFRPHPPILECGGLTPLCASEMHWRCAKTSGRASSAQDHIRPLVQTFHVWLPSARRCRGDRPTDDGGGMKEE